MDAATIVAAVLSGLGAAGIIAQIVRAIIKRIDGSAARERTQNTSLESQRALAIRERDQADARARIYWDYAARARRQIWELDSTPEEWPEEHTLTPAQIRSLRRQPKEKP